MGLEQQITPNRWIGCAAFKHWLDGITRQAYGEDPVAALKEMITDIDYEGWLAQNSGSPHQAERRMKNVWFLIDSINKMITKAEELGDGVHH